MKRKQSTLEKISTLKKVSLFSSLDEVYLKEVSSIAMEKFYRTNEVIIHQGDPGSVLFIIKSGSAKISLVDQKGGEFILKMLSENDFFLDFRLKES